ncbi:MAG: hypothetical protein CMK25_01550, partial [Porticoccaceae bacterium]|nr:hypothetical protein [Porticoccaceae bacterium]
MSRFAKISVALLSTTLVLSSGCAPPLGEEKSTLPAALSADHASGESALAVQENARAEALFDSIYRARLARSPIDQAFEGIYEQQGKWDNYSDA